MLDDWGDTLGLKGVGLAQRPLRRRARSRRTGRSSARSWSTSTSAPARPACGCTATPCTAAGRSAPFTDVAGGADGGRRLQRARRAGGRACAPRRRCTRRSCRACEDPDFQRWFGAAIGAHRDGGGRHAAGGRRAHGAVRPRGRGGHPVQLGATTCASGSSPARPTSSPGRRWSATSSARPARAPRATAQRIERMFRDMAMIAGHRNTVMRDWAFRELARAQLGLPRDFQPVR